MLYFNLLKSLQSTVLLLYLSMTAFSNMNVYCILIFSKIFFIILVLPIFSKLIKWVEYAMLSYLNPSSLRRTLDYFSWKGVKNIIELFKIS